MPLICMAVYAKGVNVYCAPTAADREAWLPSMRHIAHFRPTKFMRRSSFPPQYHSFQNNTPEAFRPRKIPSAYNFRRIERLFVIGESCSFLVAPRPSISTVWSTPSKSLANDTPSVDAILRMFEKLRLLSPRSTVPMNVL